MCSGKAGRDIRDYLNDILEMIENIRKFVGNMSYADLEDDNKTLYAVIRCLEVLGEAVKKIPPAVREKYPKIAWQEVAGMRDKLIHEYFGVDTEMIWDTVQEDILPLEQTIIKVIKELS